MSRSILFYENYFVDFYKELNEQTKRKINEILRLISDIETIPSKFFKKIEGSKVLFEIRIEQGSNIFRIFCIFDKGNILVLLSAFQKKTQKTPKSEIDRAEKLASEYADSQTDSPKK